ncbi:hypothetical protein [Pyxidicoccus trucidator]|uniref:hypothetical protein n=1 Tax=Pyxidicoccus trucidator TaxID=2709662 RepID=UPI0013DA3A7B|nr:hypothetical protein [Pyxidicoccus trucidator]
MGVAFLGAALLLGCGGDDDGGEGPDDVEPEARCDVTVTGAVSGTPVCRDVSLAYFSSDDDYTLTLETEAGARPLVLVRPSANGRPEVGTFTGPTSEVDCGVTVRDGAKAWFAYYENPQTGASLRGSCTLTFTHIELYGGGGGATTYRFKGTLQAHLLALETTGATGTVDVVTNFEL